MRRFLLALPFLFPICAHAQQAAAPVQPFSYGRPVGVASQPLVVLSVSEVLPLASLPASCADGQLVFVTDARTLLQADGAGTGVVARCQSNAWISLIDGKAVQK